MAPNNEAVRPSTVPQIAKTAMMDPKALRKCLEFGKMYYSGTHRWDWIRTATHTYLDRVCSRELPLQLSREGAIRAHPLGKLDHANYFFYWLYRRKRVWHKLDAVRETVLETAHGLIR
jgi:hypothetical protein